jgi:predicted site-specific integrase-resolvase
MANKVNQKKAAQFLQVTPITIKRWVNAGKLRCIKTGEKKVQFEIPDLERMRRIVNPTTPDGGGNTNG